MERIANGRRQQGKDAASFINGAYEKIELVRANVRSDLLLGLVEEVLNRESHRLHFTLFDLYISEGGNGLGRKIGSYRQSVSGSLCEVVQ